MTEVESGLAVDELDRIGRAKLLLLRGVFKF
jgi:hypothetical protein